MPTDRNPSDPINLWQAQEVEKVILTLDEIRTRSTRFEQRVYKRNRREYIAGAVMIALFGHQLWTTPGWRAAPAALMIAGILYVLLQLHRRASTRPLPADVGLRGSVEFHRVELERQRDALRGVWHWYLLPFAPGLVAALTVAGIDHGINPPWIGMGVFFVLVFVGIVALNRRGAKKLDRRIEELKAMETDK